MKKTISIFFVLAALILVTHSAALQLVDDVTVLSVKEGYYQYFFTNSTSEYFTVSIVINATQLPPYNCFVNSISCGQTGYSDGNRACNYDKGYITTFGSVLPNNVMFFLLTTPSSSSPRIGEILLIQQPLVSVELNIRQPVSFTQHQYRYFRINLYNKGPGVFTISAEHVDLISYFQISKQTCNDQTYGSSLSIDQVAVEVFGDCYIVIGIFTNSFVDGFVFTPILQPKLVLQPLGVPMSLVPANLTQSYGLSAQFFRIQLDNISAQLGYSTPVQLFLQVIGVSQYDYFSLYMTSIQTLPQSRSKGDAACYATNVCNVPINISDGNSFSRFFVLVPSQYIQGFNVQYSAFPVSQAPQGYQNIPFKSPRYIENDLSVNFPGGGVMYAEFAGRSSGDTAYIYEVANSVPFSQSNSYYNNNQYIQGYWLLTQPTKVGYFIDVKLFSQGYEFYYNYVPIFNFNQTLPRYVPERPYRYSPLGRNFYSAQISSFDNVASASVRLVINGATSQDAFSIYLTLPSCTINPLPTNGSCSYFPSVSSVDFTTPLVPLKPIYFSFKRESYLAGYSFGVFFNVTCVSGSTFLNGVCVRLTSSNL